MVWYAQTEPNNSDGPCVVMIQNPLRRAQTSSTLSFPAAAAAAVADDDHSFPAALAAADAARATHPADPAHADG